jgi:hypothetical protein
MVNFEFYMVSRQTVKTYHSWELAKKREKPFSENTKSWTWRSASHSQSTLTILAILVNQISLLLAFS